MSYSEKYYDKIKRFIYVCHKLSSKMYATSYGGNLAWRLEEGLFLVTPTRVNKGDIKTEDLVFINASGEKLEGANLQQEKLLCI